MIPELNREVVRLENVLFFSGMSGFWLDMVFFRV